MRKQFTQALTAGIAKTGWVRSGQLSLAIYLSSSILYKHGRKIPWPKNHFGHPGRKIRGRKITESACAALDLSQIFLSHDVNLRRISDSRNFYDKKNHFNYFSTFLKKMLKTVWNPRVGLLKYSKIKLRVRLEM